ncbi:hypothetical protein HYW75_06515 [Candidatus Pacearchaeota archaeon]|nr:hypothetical protein [Candidatus Pacearchaeota archaeon]
MKEIIFISKTKRIGKSIVVTIPQDIVEKENLNEREIIEITRIKKL